MFTAALFTTAKTRKQPDCSPTHKWIKKIGQKHTMEYHSATKKNKPCPLQQHGWTQRLSYQGKSVKDKDTYHMISLVWYQSLIRPPSKQNKITSVGKDGAGAPGDCMVVPQTTACSSSPPWGRIFKRTEIEGAKKYFYMPVYRSIIHNSQEGEAASMFT